MIFLGYFLPRRGKREAQDPATFSAGAAHRAFWNAMISFTHGVWRIVQDKERFRVEPLSVSISMGKPRDRHSATPSSRRDARKPEAWSISTAWGAIRQNGPRQ
jgi:hypothetical protein